MRSLPTIEMRLSLVLAVAPGFLLPASTVHAWTGSVQQDRMFEPSAYDPRGDPRLPSGEPNPEYDPRYDPAHSDFDYDASKDEGHPLKGSGRPDGAWDDAIARGDGDWQWGEVYFDGEYPVRLRVSNDCAKRQTVHISVRDNPYLTLPETDEIPPGGKSVVGTIETPPAPVPPIPAAGEPGPNWPGGWGWGHVVPPDLIAPGWHQPNFLEVGGEVEAWHPWDPGARCAPNVTTWKIAGHVHFRPPAGDDEGAGIAAMDACQVYWLTLELPPDLEEVSLDETCLDRIRQLALEWRERIVAPYAERSPRDWAWLPRPEEIREMAVAALLAMKARGDEVMRGSSSS